MLEKVLVLSFSLLPYISHAQQREALSNVMKEYTAAQTEVNKRFNSYFNANYRKLYALPEPTFILKNRFPSAIVQH